MRIMGLTVTRASLPDTYYPALSAAFKTTLKPGSDFTPSDLDKVIGKPNPDWGYVEPDGRARLIGSIFRIVHKDPLHGAEFRRCSRSTMPRWRPSWRT